MEVIFHQHLNRNTLNSGARQNHFPNFQAFSSVMVMIIFTFRFPAVLTCFALMSTELVHKLGQQYISLHIREGLVRHNCLPAVSTAPKAVWLADRAALCGETETEAGLPRRLPSILS